VLSVKKSQVQKRSRDPPDRRAEHPASRLKAENSQKTDGHEGEPGDLQGNGHTPGRAGKTRRCWKTVGAHKGVRGTLSRPSKARQLISDGPTTSNQCDPFLSTDVYDGTATHRSKRAVEDEGPTARPPIQVKSEPNPRTPINIKTHEPIINRAPTPDCSRNHSHLTSPYTQTFTW